MQEFETWSCRSDLKSAIWNTAYSKELYVSRGKLCMLFRFRPSFSWKNCWKLTAYQIRGEGVRTDYRLRRCFIEWCKMPIERSYGSVLVCSESRASQTSTVLLFWLPQYIIWPTTECHTHVFTTVMLQTFAIVLKHYLWWHAINNHKF